MDRDAAASLAIDAFTFIAGDDERLARFLDATGLKPDRIREAAASPDFLLAVLDYVAADEALLLDFARSLPTEPERIMEAHYTLSPSDFS
jgi:hypothetical protein